MAISEKKIQIVLDRYFQSECDVNTSIRQAFEKGFRLGLKKGQSADRPKGYIHINDIYKRIAGHSNYHGDAILAAFTCLTEGKEVKSVEPLDIPEKPKGKWIDDGDTLICNKCRIAYNHPLFHHGWNYCPNCGAKMEMQDRKE